jgi:hypothetical protein
MNHDTISSPDDQFSGNSISRGIFYCIHFIGYFGVLMRRTPPFWRLAAWILGYNEVKVITEPIPARCGVFNLSSSTFHGHDVCASCCKVAKLQDKERFKPFQPGVSRMDERIDVEKFGKSLGLD